MQSVKCIFLRKFKVNWVTQKRQSTLNIPFSVNTKDFQISVDQHFMSAWGAVDDLRLRVR